MRWRTSQGRLICIIGCCKRVVEFILKFGHHLTKSILHEQKKNIKQMCKDSMRIFLIYSKTKQCNDGPHEYK
jgi:hypothetical protein